MIPAVSGKTSGSISAREARALALRAQGFGSGFSASPRQPIRVLDFLGVIQLDSVNVVARSHELIPFARLGPCSREAMTHAIYHQKRGFEYWGHEASWLPIAEYRYFLPRMERRRREARGWWKDVREQNAALYPLVLERVRQEGPIGAAAFEDPRAQRGTWWDWKPAKLVLEDLFDRGELMVADRTRGFARLYDLPERVLPPGVDTTAPTADEAARYLLRRGLAALGVATATDMADYFRLRPEDWRPALAAVVEHGDVVRVEVEGWKAPAYALPETLAGAANVRVPRHRPTLLSPFDNLVWERQRTERIFDFFYRIEIYTPQEKRQYGYYVLPLLARGQLGGRVDVKLDRPTRTLRALGVYLDGAEPEEAASALQDLAAHLGAEAVEMPSRTISSASSEP